MNDQAVGHFSLQPGQTLNMGNGFAEVLPTPGTFLRIGNNSEFRMTSAGLADTRIDLMHGKALLEVDQLIDGTRLSVDTGGASNDVLKKGLYSFDADQQAVRVLDGKLKVVSAAKSREIGKHDQVLLANGDGLKKTDFDERQMKVEPLYVWSEARSRDEAGRNQLAAENSAGYLPAQAGWFWDPYANYYGFWPSSAYLYSPFGFGFYGGGYWGGYYPRVYRNSGFRYGRPAGVQSRVGGYSNYRGSFGSGAHAMGSHGGGHR